MGLLEKAEQKKKGKDKTKKLTKSQVKEETKGLLEKAQIKKQIKIDKDYYEINKPIEKETEKEIQIELSGKKRGFRKKQEKLKEGDIQGKSLLLAQQEEEQKTEETELLYKGETVGDSDQIVIDNDVELGDDTKVRIPGKGTVEQIKAEHKGVGITGEDIKDLIEERTGFGWKGLGSRKIVFDKNINEYVYELVEPELNEQEEELKKELAHLFKMLSDIDVTEINEEEKAKYLEKTLEQIIIDNNIQFDVSKWVKKQDKKPGLFAKKGKTKDTDKKDKEKKKEPKIKEKKEKIVRQKKGLKLNKPVLTEEEKELKDKIFYHIFREFLGYGRIDIVMSDEGIEDISCDGTHVPIFIYHKKYDAIPTNIWFKDDQELNSFVVRLAQISGKQISVFSPIVDGKLPDGSRLQTTLAKTVTRGSTFTIRKFKETPLTPVDLIDFKSISLDMAAYFWMAIEKGASILFCGGTASGKTTALNALSLFIPAQNKIISIEDTLEVNLPHKNWIAGTTREGFSASDQKTGKDIDMFDLIRAALRQRPKVVMVGEVRGKEAYSLFQAMATGHTSYATVHASDIHTLIQRLENPPIALPRALLTSLDVIVFQNAIDIKGKTVRRMMSVTEIVKLDPDTNQLIFMEPFRWISKTDDRFENAGASKILNEIRLQNDWSEEHLQNEIENRKLILRWMLEKDIRDYKDVGRIVSDYSKYPDELIKKAKEELKK